MRTRLWIGEKFFLAIQAKTAFAILRVEIVGRRHLKTENCHVSGAAATAGFDWLQTEFVGCFLQLRFGATFQFDVVMTCKDGRKAYSDVEELRRYRLKISVVKDIDACVGKTLSNVRIVVEDRDSNAIDSHVSTEEVFQHGFHVG